MGSVKVVKASAGSGKTYRLAYEYIKAVVEEPSLYRNILAVTFTNKATEEMKRRIVAELNALAMGRHTTYMDDLGRDLGFAPEQIISKARVARTRILHDYSRFSVLTIDKFFQRIIRSFIKELGIDLNFNLELRTDTILSSATDALIDDIGIDKRLRAWIVDFVEEKMEQSRRWEVKGDLSDLGREIFREDYRRMAESVRPRDELAAIVSDIDRKASDQKEVICKTARQAMDIMSQRGLEVDDFSNKGSGVAGYIAKTAAGLMVMYGKRVRDAIDSDDKWVAKSSPDYDRVMTVVALLRPLLEKICSAMPAYLKLETSVRLLNENFRNFALLGDLSDKVRQMCDQANIMPISETNAILGKLISGNDTPFIFEKAGNHFERFMMDEFQDTSAMQWENFLPLLGNAVAQSPDSPVLIVGDVKQSIYRWRGGDWQILDSGVDSSFAGVEHESLSVNYRSDRRIVEFNNDIITECVTLDSVRLDETLAQAREEGHVSASTVDEMSGLMARAYEGHTQTPACEEHRGYVNITMYASDDDAPAVPPVIKRVEQLQRRGYAPGDIAFLVRSNKEGEAIAAILLEHKSRNTGSRYCYDVVTQEALTIGLSPVARFVAACFELSANPNDNVRRALYNQWHDRNFCEELPGDESDFIASLRTLSPEEAFEAVSIRFDLGTRKEDSAFLQAFHEQIISFGKSNVADIPLFLRWWDETGAVQSINIPPSDRAMTIITVHKAKGLDFKTVILPYCDWPLDRKARSIVWALGGDEFEDAGVMPLNYKKDMGASHFADSYYREMVMSHIDNVNLLYVALTRARNELHIMIPADIKEIAAGRRRTGGRIGSLLLDGLSFAPGNGTAAVSGGQTVGRTRHAGRYRVFEFGVASVVRSVSATSTSIDVGFRSYAGGDRLKLRFPMTRYVADEGFVPDIMPRDFGVMMHRAFERATTKDDIHRNISKMQTDGTVSSKEATRLVDAFEHALREPVVASWFTGQWDEVRNENDIILPLADAGEGFATRRPDRVMIRGRSAVIVDYKFGLRRDARYNAQLRRYASILGQMGYADVEAYIWYVSLGDVERI